MGDGLRGQRASLTKVLPIYRGHHVMTPVFHVITAVFHGITAVFVAQVVCSPRPCCENCVVESCWGKLFQLGTGDLCKTEWQRTCCVTGRMRETVSRNTRAVL